MKNKHQQGNSSVQHTRIFYFRVRSCAVTYKKLEEHETSLLQLLFSRLLAFSSVYVLVSPFTRCSRTIESRRTYLPTIIWNQQFEFKQSKWKLRLLQRALWCIVTCHDVFLVLLQTFHYLKYVVKGIAVRYKLTYSTSYRIRVRIIKYNLWKCNFEKIQDCFEALFLRMDNLVRIGIVS